jgi:hypothetical protein
MMYRPTVGASSVSPILPIGPFSSPLLATGLIGFSIVILYLSSDACVSTEKPAHGGELCVLT